MRPSARKRDKRDGWYWFTPAQALKILETGMIQQRPTKHTNVDTLALAMLNKEFWPNGETVKFDEHGKCIDGKHRMLAGVQSGVEFETYVVFSIPRKYFTTIDVGIQKGGSDTAAIMGTPQYTFMAAVMRWAIAFEDKTAERSVPSVYSTKQTNQRVAEAIKKHKDAVLPLFDRAHELVPNWKRTLKGMLPPAVLFFVYWQMTRFDVDKAERFFRGVVKGDNLGETSPMFALRSRLTGGVALPPGVIPKMHLTIKAANLYLSGGQTALVKIGPFENFPAVGEEPRSDRRRKRVMMPLGAGTTTSLLT